MPVTATAKLTVEETANLPDPPGAYYELRRGELAAVTYPRKRHDVLQDRIQSLLRALIGKGFFVRIEFSFRPHAEHELRRADVAAVDLGRWGRLADDAWLLGSPELVVEVLSPSNTIGEMFERMDVCMEGGATEFWLVDAASQTVRVFHADRSYQTYHLSDKIPLTAFGAAELPVADIFAE